MSFRKSLVLSGLAALSLAGCAKDGDFDSSGGIAVTRSSCPAVAVPVYTGDVTLFNPATSRDASAIDVVASLTNMRTNCADQGEDIVASGSFDVQATRTNTSGARRVEIPYFVTVVQGGRAVVSKRINTVVLDFADGQARASGHGTAAGFINKAAATLPADIQEKLTRKRKAGDMDAAIDPLADPEVKAAVQRASFELLVGFQLTEAQLQYNATR